MRFIKLTIITISLFFMACNPNQTDEMVYATPYPETRSSENISVDQGYYERDNLELQAVGLLLEKSNNLQDFERRLNSNNNVNNFDLNGDGYVDYISVSEYDDRDANQRGFTLYDRFGPNDIQEIVRIIFDRDRSDNRGARILLSGNEQIYGDNYYYETNWIDKSLAITSWAFSDRNTSYQSPYYYDNYPDNYEVYRVVETPVYRTRIEEYYPEMYFVKTLNPTISQIRIKSSYKDKSADKIFGKLAKPSKGQAEFRKNNPNKPEFVPVQGKKANDISSKPEKKIEKASKDSEKALPNQNKKVVNGSQPNKIENKKVSQPKVNQVKKNVNGKVNRPNKGKKDGGGKSGKPKHVDHH